MTYVVDVSTHNNSHSDLTIPVMEEKTFDDDYQCNHIQSRNSLRPLLSCLLTSIILSWFMGAGGLSVAWLLLIVALVIARWNSHVTLLLSEARWGEVRRVRRQRALEGSESAEWLNILFNRWLVKWVCSTESMFKIARDRFEPLLNESKPSFVENIELRQFTLGEQTPCVQSIRSYDVAKEKNGYGLCGKANRSTKQYITLEASIHLNSEEFRLILGARLFSKGIGVDVDVAMEKLYLSGKLAVTFTLDMMVPFPHVTGVKTSFLEKPDVWFSCRILKSVQMMDVPVLKTWLHSVVSDALETALVDPGHVTWVPGTVKQNVPTPDSDNSSNSAQGVLIVTLTSPTDNVNEADHKWMILRLGEQKWRTSPLTTGWIETPCFLVESLLCEKLIVKLKSKRLVSSVTLAQYEMSLDEYNLENTQFVETHLQKRNPRVKDVPSIGLRLEYVPLTTINLDEPPPTSLSLSSRPHCGVLTVFVHGAQGLTSCDAQQCNPYCILFNNRRKVKSTPYLANNVCPQWQKSFQLLIYDISQVALSFVVCSWNPKKMTDDEMLGVAVLNMTQEDTWITNKVLALSGNPHASLTVSVVFQPVPRMGSENNEAPLCADSIDGGVRVKRNSSSWMYQAKSFLGRTDQEIQSGTDITNILASGLGLMEISILRARDLMAMDLNGFSDPYCELKVNNECRYKTSVRKKTLNPQWDENAIMGMPRPGETFDIIVWDHDTFGMKDFLGNVSFSLDEIRQVAKRETPVWFCLQGVRSGELEIRIKVISDDTSNEIGVVKQQMSRLTSDESPLPRRGSMERSRVRLGVHVPPPTPPRTVSITHKKTEMPLCDDVIKGDLISLQSDVTVPRVTVTDSPSITRASSRTSSHHTVESLPPSPLYEPEQKKKESDMSGFRSMRLKVSRSLRLRRFKSEVNVRSQTTTNGTLNGLLSSGLTRDILNHAVSQPSINKPFPVRPTELNLNSSARPDTYTGVEGRVIQVQGLHVAHVAQLYCRIKLVGAFSRKDKHGIGKTLAKSHLLPAMPNPQFQLDFQISSPETVPRQAVLLFEIRSSGKEVLALRRVTLQDLLSGDLKETHTWLALNNGATLEVSIAHGRTLKKQSKKLFRSWSVHRIGKV